MALLHSEPVFLVERQLLAQATRANGVSAVIEQHRDLVGWKR
jgi:hypothetical protein